MTKWLYNLVWVIAVMALTACGFKPQGQMTLAKPLHSIYVSSIHPYGDLARSLELQLKSSSVKLATNEKDADTVLVISQDTNSQELAAVSNTQQTRQYNLYVTTTFAVNKSNGVSIIAPQTLRETRAITIQSDQILGSSNEATLYYQQMRRDLANAIMNRLSSRSITRAVDAAFAKKPGKKKSTS